MNTAKDIVDYWLGLDPSKWFKKSAAFDEELRTRFSGDVEAAMAGHHDDWRDDPTGSLAIVLLLDQMTRNIHRASVDMYKGDPKALATAKHALSLGHDLLTADGSSIWYYMPFMHSEDRADQERCVGLITMRKLDSNLPWAIDHADIVRRFGRFPHRNKLLGRSSTAEELEFIEAGGFSG